MSYEAFEFRIEDNVARITLNEAERGNPIDGTFCQEFAEIAVECDENAEIRAVLIDARGKFFSVGGDLKTFTRDREQLPRFVKSATKDMHSAVSRFARMDAPVVIALHSLVTGGAVALTAAADFALADVDTRFYAAFTGIGFSCDCGTSYFLPRRVGTRRATEFLLRNEQWTAQQAESYGLINTVCANPASVAEQAAALASELAHGPTVAFGAVKRLLRSTFEQALEAQLEAESRALADCSRTDDAWGALNAVQEKRVPAFRGH